MRVVVTRPQADGERTAAALEALGHEVLVAPLMRVEPVAADLAGDLECNCDNERECVAGDSCHG